MAITQKTVAQQAGVTRSVVSHVMHGGSQTIRVSPETAERVRQVAQELGYQPNTVARNFRRQRTGMIGVVHGDVSPRLRLATGSGYFATLLDGIVDGAFGHSYSIALCPDLFQTISENALADGRFDGFIWYSTVLSESVENRILRCVSPIVVLHAKAKDYDDRFPTVICDNEQGLRLAVEHLTRLGHRRIGFLYDGRDRYRECLLRLHLFRGIASDAGIEAMAIDLWKDRGLSRYFAKLPKETALIAHSETYAFQALAAARDHGIRVPDELSIIGFDSTLSCEAQTPPLTAISQPLEQMGGLAVDILVDLIEGNAPQKIETVLPCGIDVRGSTGPVRS